MAQTQKAPHGMGEDVPLLETPSSLGRVFCDACHLSKGQPRTLANQQLSCLIHRWHLTVKGFTLRRGESLSQGKDIRCPQVIEGGSKGEACSEIKGVGREREARASDREKRQREEGGEKGARERLLPEP